MSPMRKIALMVTFICVIRLGSSQQYDSDEYSGADASEEKVEDSGFVTPLDFSPLFGGGQFGLSSAASNPASEILQRVPQKYQSLFDVSSVVSQTNLGGQDFFQGQSSDKQFSPESFGFVPTFSQGLSSASPSLGQPKRYLENSVQIERTKATAKTSALTRAPLQFNIQTKHDNSYKKPEPSKVPQLASYKDKSQPSLYNPTPITDYKISHTGDVSQLKSEDHLAPYKKYSFQSQGNLAPIPTYQALTSNYPNSYPGSYPQAQLGGFDPKIYRYKRYSGTRNNKKKAKGRSAKLRQQEEEEDEEDDSPYNYHSDYKSRPKEFDENRSYDSPDFSGYDEDEKAELKKYDYGEDDEYNSDEYERIKGLSEQQAAEVKKNPENCKEVVRDTMTCQVCQNPKTGGSFESCSYVSEPKNNKYAYVKEQKFDSNDQPDSEEETTQQTKSQPLKTNSQNTSKNNKPNRGGARYQHGSNDRKQKKNNKPKYDDYYDENPQAESTQATKYATYIEHKDDDDEGDEQDKYQSPIPGFFTDNEQKKNVELVLAEFAKKDRSACKKVFKNEMTCYLCTDNKGLKNEECMFVSESAPKSSHLAYKEVKEFNSKPDNKNAPTEGNDEAESKVRPTSKPAPLGYSFLPSTVLPTESVYLKQRKNPVFKKYSGKEELTGKKSFGSTSSPYIQPPTILTRLDGVVKRNTRSNAPRERVQREQSPTIAGPTVRSQLYDIAPPSDFAGKDSKGAFWAETVPTYSKTLGVTLPKYMTQKSDQEKAFDKFLSQNN